MIRHCLRPIAAGALLLSGGAVLAQGDRVSLTAIRAIETGAWQLRDRGGATERLCVSNPTTLLQIRHGRAQCTHLVVENSPRVATIQYSCPGHGHGRTTVSVETPRLVRVETQGVLDGSPFSADMEGRRTGACN